MTHGILLDRHMQSSWGFGASAPQADVRELKLVRLTFARIPLKTGAMFALVEAFMEQSSNSNFMWEFHNVREFFDRTAG